MWFSWKIAMLQEACILDGDVWSVICYYFNSQLRLLSMVFSVSLFPQSGTYHGHCLQMDTSVATLGAQHPLCKY